jgi:hypothetical protein
MADIADPIVARMIMGVVAILVSINIYFVKSLVDKIDKADHSINKYEIQITALNVKINEFTLFVKEMMDLKSEIAVIKYSLEMELKKGR